MEGAGLDGRRKAGPLAHVACVLVLVLLCLAAGAWTSGFDLSLLKYQGVVEEGVATSGAGESGQSYVVFLNTRAHPDADERAGWVALFSGDDASRVTGAATCLTAAGDVDARNLALRLAGRLEAGQLSVRVDDAMLIVSKAEVGRFDILAMTAGVAEALDVSVLEADPSVEVVRI